MTDINKKYRTRDGREVRIYATDGVGVTTIHGAIYKPFYDNPKAENDFMEWCLTCWQSNGKHILESYDLIEVKPRIKQRVWINVYPDHCLGAYHEKKDADEQAAPHRIGCVQVEIDCEEGDGL